jgi:hypothetical protein
MSSTRAASAAEATAQCKNTKYSDIAQLYLFYPVAVETMGPINEVSQDFIPELSHRVFSVTEDPRETSFIFQRLSVAVQRFNAVCLTNSFSHDHTDLANRLSHT